MDINAMRTKLQGMLFGKTFQPFADGVRKRRKELAKMYGADEKKSRNCRTFARLRKEFFSKDQMFSMFEKYSVKLDEETKSRSALIHAFLGAEVAKDLFGVDDDEIYDAIFLSYRRETRYESAYQDYLHSGRNRALRNYDGVEHLRELAHSDLDKALVYQIDITIKSVLKKGSLLHLNTVDTRNYYLSR
ncbi:MAG: hypothetical protein L6V93_09610 [Clostridiales bacterium]|nr:MAG: hypothetical protein L6V93_09610 [Clostridiales bacterium]